MKILSWNVNGIRAVWKKGFMDFLNKEEPDVCCIQEIKAQVGILPDEIVNPSGYHGIWNSGMRKGYSGVATFTKLNPEYVENGFGVDIFDFEGRVLRTDFGKISLFNVYFPNGQKDENRLQYKLDFYDAFFKYLETVKSDGQNIIIAGDFNTAHKEIDLANPKANEKYSGFLPIEREWMDKIIAMGYVDVFRQFNKEPHQYTWWSYRFKARMKNVGWRIDYFLVNKELVSRIKNCKILSNVLGSDHCPILLEIDNY